MFHPPWPDLEFRRGLDAVLREFRPDLIHAHGWSVYSAAALGRGRPKIVCSLHDYGLCCPKKSLLRWDHVCQYGKGWHCWTCDSVAQPLPRRVALAAAIRIGWPWLHPRVSHFLAVSSYVRERHIEQGVEAEEITVVHPVTDALPAADGTAKPVERPYLLYVGPGDEGPHKGRSRLIEAFLLLEQDDYSLVLVGGRDRLAVRHPRIIDAGYLRGAPLVSAFRAASVAVVPSIWADPCPLVAVEALSVGVPVVASNVGGLRDIVADGVAGLLVQPNDSGALAQAIQTLLADDALRKRMSSNAPRTVSRFSGDEIFPQLVSIYEDAIDRRPSR